MEPEDIVLAVVLIVPIGGAVALVGWNVIRAWRERASPKSGSCTANGVVRRCGRGNTMISTGRPTGERDNAEPDNEGCGPGRFAHPC